MTKKMQPHGAEDREQAIQKEQLVPRPNGGGGAGKRKLSVLDEQREGQCGLSSVSKGKSSHNEDREIGRAQIM